MHVKDANVCPFLHDSLKGKLPIPNLPSCDEGQDEYDLSKDEGIAFSSIPFEYLHPKEPSRVGSDSLALCMLCMLRIAALWNHSPIALILECV